MNAYMPPEPSEFEKALAKAKEVPWGTVLIGAGMMIGCIAAVCAIIVAFFG